MAEKRKTARRLGPWLGGYVRETKRGGKRGRMYVIERWQGGSRIHVSTGCSTERGALDELERFERDPFGYVPGGDAAKVVRLTAEMVGEYRAHQLQKGLTVEWTDEVARCLADWMLAFGAMDLRALHLHRDLKAALTKWPTRVPQRIKALKGLSKWLYEERGLTERDFTAGLRVPRAKAAKWNKAKVVPFEHVKKVWPLLKQPTRDILELLTGTALHVTEVKRWVEGLGDLLQPNDSEAFAVMVVRQKNGEFVKKTLKFEAHFDAALRLRALDKMPKRMTTARHMIAACDAAGVPRFGLGQIRHSVLTWGVKDGATVPEAAEFAHHRSTETTKRHYLDLQQPNVIPLRRLDV